MFEWLYNKLSVDGLYSREEIKGLIVSVIFLCSYLTCLIWLVHGMIQKLCS